MIKLGLIVIIILAIAWLFFYMMHMPGKSYEGPFLALSNKETDIKAQLYHHIHELAEVIGPRNIGQPKALAEAADYIKNQLRQSGFEVTTQTYKVDGVVSENIIAQIVGQKENEVILIGAHYDSVMPDSKGANDNGSGTAALLVLANQLATKQFSRTVRFVFFVNEEPPFFKTKNMGSYHYVQQLENSESIKAMISLETIGYYSDDKGSQRYPFPFSYFYPDKGNFIGFVANLASHKLLVKALKEFRATTQFPSEGAALLTIFPGVDWSDQWAFWQANIPAMMITDTALFRYPYYHMPDDSIDKINFEAMARVVGGLENIIITLVNENQL